MNWKKLEDECFQITLNIIKSLLHAYKDDELYALCLYTDSGAMTVSLSANSQKDLSQLMNLDEDNSQEIENYYRWAFSEWAYDSYNSSEFSKISKILREDPSRDIDFDFFFTTLINSLTNVLCRVRSTEIEPLKQTIFFISITDNDDSESIENDTAKLLNSQDGHCNFIARYN